MKTIPAKLICLSVLLILGNVHVYAEGGSYKAWGRELKDRESKGMSIPSYCKAKFNESFPEMTKQQIADEKAYLEESYWHVHHFCKGLVYVWDLDAATISGSWHPKNALRQIDYYYTRTRKDHPIMRDVHRAYSTVYRHAGNDKKSKEHREKSFQISTFRSPKRKTSAGKRPTGKTSVGKSATPRRIPGPSPFPSASASRYVEMADKMMRVGLPGEAVELLELARKIEPNSKLIEAKLKAAKAAQ